VTTHRVLYLRSNFALFVTSMSYENISRVCLGIKPGSHGSRQNPPLLQQVVMGNNETYIAFDVGAENVSEFLSTCVQYMNYTQVHAIFGGSIPEDISTHAGTHCSYKTWKKPTMADIISEHDEKLLSAQQKGVEEGGESVTLASNGYRALGNEQKPRILLYHQYNICYGAYPLELEGIIDRTTFLRTISELNNNSLSSSIFEKLFPRLPALRFLGYFVLILFVVTVIPVMVLFVIEAPQRRKREELIKTESESVYEPHGLKLQKRLQGKVSILELTILSADK